MREVWQRATLGGLYFGLRLKSDRTETTFGLSAVLSPRELCAAREGTVRCCQPGKPWLEPFHPSMSSSLGVSLDAVCF